jgi:hypothetical protein
VNILCGLSILLDNEIERGGWFLRGEEGDARKSGGSFSVFSGL